MPYLGNPAVDRFTSTKAASVYSGNGSTTAFTLEHSVGADEDILVSVDGVIQEPSVAYAVSSGTTLTFTAAPSSNSGNNIFVYYLFRTIGTVTHPPTSALSATSGTFSAGVSGTTGTFTGVVQATDDIGNSFNQFYALGDGNVGGVRFGNTTATNGFIYYDNGSNMNFHSAGVEHMRISSIGAVTKPLQPAFWVRPASEQSNLALNSTITVLWGTETYDQNADFASITFTAPVTGKYFMHARVTVQSIDSAASYYNVNISTSNGAHALFFDPRGMDADTNMYPFNVTAVVDMDANDTAIITILQPNGTAQTDILHSASYSSWYGYLLG